MVFCLEKEMNPGRLFKLKNAWDTFTRNHPKFPCFLEAVSKQGLKEGTIVEITVTTPEGKKISSNVKLQASDILLYQELTKE